MGRLSLTIFASFLVYFIYFILICESVTTADGKVTNNLETIPDDIQNIKNTWNRFANKKLNRPIYAFTTSRRDRLSPAEFEFIDDLDSMDKRSNFDDYGHLRFGKRQDGKRNQDWEDYGHMRFGKRR